MFFQQIFPLMFAAIRKFEIILFNVKFSFLAVESRHQRPITMELPKRTLSALSFAASGFMKNLFYKNKILTAILRGIFGDPTMKNPPELVQLFLKSMFCGSIEATSAIFKPAEKMRFLLIFSKTSSDTSSTTLNKNLQKSFSLIKYKNARIQHNSKLGKFGISLS